MAKRTDVDDHPWQRPPKPRRPVLPRLTNCQGPQPYAPVGYDTRGMGWAHEPRYAYRYAAEQRPDLYFTDCQGEA